MKKKYCLLAIFTIISFILLIAIYILILVQNIINIIFYMDKRKDIIAERFVYEQFSHEVYSNIKSKIIYDIKTINKDQSECDTDYSLLKFPIKLETFYDCENIYNNLLHEGVCQNRITNSAVCCEPKCCRTIIKEKKYYYTCVNKTSFFTHDVRENICSKINKYNGNFHYVGNNQFCGKKLEKTYEELLSEFDENSKNDYSEQEHIFYDNFSHYINKAFYNIDSSKIFVQNIFSVNRPFFFDMKNSIRISTMLNKKKYKESEVLDELKKFNEISESNIKDAFKSDNFNFSDSYNNYKFNARFSISELLSGSEVILEKYKNDKYLKSGIIDWYYRTYIGFENINELKKFKKYFDENDNKNNSLYKMVNSLVTFSISIISIIIIGILFIFNIIFLIYHFYQAKQKKLDLIIFPYDKIVLSFIIVSAIIFVIFLVFYLSCFIFYYDNIEINMEIFFMIVLDKYNERRMQIYLLIAIIISFFDLLLSDTLYLFNKYLNQNSIVNVKPDNIIFVKFKLKDEDKNCIHDIKLDKNKSLSDYYNNFESILKRCRKCNDSCIEIGKITVNNREIGKDTIIGSVDINEESVLIISDE